MCPTWQATTEGDHLGGDSMKTGGKQEDGAAAAEAMTARRSKHLNLACNDVVRTILKGNGDEDAKKLRARLELQRHDLVVPGDDVSQLFFDNLVMVCQHEFHPQVGQLRGDYAKAWRNILHYIEDAGWQITDPPFSISG